MYLSTNAPYTPALAAKRHQGMFDDVALPNPPSFNEADVLDKPAWICDTLSLTPEEGSKLGQRYRQRLRSLQSVDEMVGKLVGVLSETGELSNTYIVFTSENGLHLSEHRRFAMKWTAYKEAVHVSPLLVRGSGVPRGVSRSQMELNNDLAPTFASWAGLDAAELSGRTLAQLTPFYEPSDLLEKRPAGRALAAPYSAPVHEYAHGSTDTTGCSITGGTFYNPTTVQFPSGYGGNYFFADLCSGWIRTYDPSTGTASGFATGLEMLIDLEVSKAGQLYYLTRGSPTSVGKIGYAAN